jgi:hypothetical protein
MPRAFRNAAFSMGVNIDKALVLEGRPNEIIDHRQGDDALRNLKKLVPWLIVDSTAEELPSDDSRT